MPAALVEGFPDHREEIRVARHPHWVAISPDGTRFYTANHESNLSSALDTSDDRVVAEIPVRNTPQAIAWSPDGRFAPPRTSPRTPSR